MTERNEVGPQTPPDETSPPNQTTNMTTGSTASGTTAPTSSTTTTTTTGNTTDQTNGDTKTPPYNFRFAVICVVAAGLIFLLTMLIFRGLVKAPADAAIVAGALGGLFTLIGTVAGAYFGIKSTQDENDKSRQRVDEAHKRESAAVGALDPNKAAELRRQGLL